VIAHPAADETASRVFESVHGGAEGRGDSKLNVGRSLPSASTEAGNSLRPFEDAGYSAKDLKRPGIRIAVEQLERGKAPALVWRANRPWSERACTPRLFVPSWCLRVPARSPRDGCCPLSRERNLTKARAVVQMSGRCWESPLTPQGTGYGSYGDLRTTVFTDALRRISPFLDAATERGGALKRCDRRAGPE
jgi:hypothetical protein